MKTFLRRLDAHNFFPPKQHILLRNPRNGAQSKELLKEFFETEILLSSFVQFCSFFSIKISKNYFY